MQVFTFICCGLVLICLFNLGNPQAIQEKIVPRDVDGLEMDQSMKMKRPFCNAFTGCGRKRSFYGGPPDSQDYENRDELRLYKTLMRAANQNVQDLMNRVSNSYRIPGPAQDYVGYVEQKPSFRARIQS